MSHPGCFCNSTPLGRVSSGRRGFTLTEVLVVIGILAVLAGLLLVALPGIRARGVTARIQSDLQTISVALEAYRQDCGDYPRLDANNTMPDPLSDAIVDDETYLTGAELLCWALVAPYDAVAGGSFEPVDGADGPGFRQRGTRGQVYGPYLNMDRFKVETYQDDRYPVLKDSEENPILYFAAIKDRSAATSVADRAKTAWYDVRDNEMYFTRETNWSDDDERRDRIRAVLGDRDRDGVIDSDETFMAEAAFVVWSAGKDGAFGPEDPGNAAEVKQCDDVLSIP